MTWNTGTPWVLAGAGQGRIGSIPAGRFASRAQDPGSVERRARHPTAMPEAGRMHDADAAVARDGCENQRRPVDVTAIARVDGRRLRSRRTRQRLVVAYLDLLSETGRRPTCAAVSKRAGMSVRTLFERFDNMADLVRAAAAEDVAACGAPVTLDRVARIRLHVRRWARRCEEGLDRDDLAGLAELETIYDRELSGLDVDQRRRIMIVLTTLLDAGAWWHVRQRFGNSFAEACAVWEAATGLSPVRLTGS